MPHGLTVRADEVRSLLGLSKPEDGDETIGGRMPVSDLSDEAALNSSMELNAASAGSQSDSGFVSDIESDYARDLVPISDEIAEVLEKAADKSTDFDSFKAELLRLSSEWSADKTAELMATAFFSARAKGDSNFAG